MLAMLKSFWAAVRRVFPEAWNLPPRRSRLMHGVGVVSLGFVMDAIADRTPESVPDVATFTSELSVLKDVCRWTSGSWTFGPHNQRKWNDLQNTPRDIQLLTNYLLFEYKARAWQPDVAKRRDA
jgi:hypothetical protein